MYINWAHHYIPKVSGACSVVVNFFFIYILQNDKKNELGCYRYLLLFFAVYNLTCTSGDVLVPMVVHDYRYAFSIFISDGFFERKSTIGGILISFRCGLIPVTYAILHSHFVYRYLVLFSTNFLTHWFIPYGLILTVSYCILVWTAWFSACYFFLFSDTERTTYLERSFNDLYHTDIFDINILTALYQEGSSETIRQSWIGIIITSFISVYSITVYIVLGVLIVQKLDSERLHMSQRTRKMQHQLMKALAVQALIPIFVSFLPCIIVLYQPVFNVDFGRWLDLTACVAISLFPVLDPLALFYVIPTFRKRILEIMMEALQLLVKGLDSYQQNEPAMRDGAAEPNSPVTYEVSSNRYTQIQDTVTKF